MTYRWARSPTPAKTQEGHRIGTECSAQARHLRQAPGDERCLPFSPYPSPNAIPLAVAMTFFTAPPTSVPIDVLRPAMAGGVRDRAATSFRARDINAGDGCGGRLVE